MNTCHACYKSDFDGSWWCDNCDQWPCRCVPQEGDDAPQETSVHEEAVPVPAESAGGSATDAADPAGVHGVPVRQAQEPDVAPEQEAARLSVLFCWHCGRPGIQGQAFSGGQEYYCPHCNDVFPYRAHTSHGPAECIVKELKRAGATGAVVADGGDLDGLVANMLAEGYALGETVYVHGKRIRYLTYSPVPTDE